MTDKIRSCVSTCGKTRTSGQRVPAHSDRPLQGQPPRLTLRPPAHTRCPSREELCTSLVQNGEVLGSLQGTVTFLCPDARHIHLPLLSQFLPQPLYNMHTHTHTITATKGPQQPGAVAPEIPNQRDGEPPRKTHRWHPQGRSAMPPPSDT